MSIEDFINAAKASSTITALARVEDVSTTDFTNALDALDVTSNSKSITDEQFLALKALIAEYRAEIMKGSFVETPEALHNIVMFFRVTREESFVVVKEKPVRAKAAGRSKKEIPSVGYLM